MLRAAGVLSAGITGAGALGIYKLRDDMGPDSLNRLLSFYSVAVPLVLDYKILEMKCETLPTVLPQFFDPVTQEEESKLFEPLHEKWKQPLVDKLMELGGFFYKVSLHIYKTKKNFHFFFFFITFSLLLVSNIHIILCFFFKNFRMDNEVLVIWEGSCQRFIKMKCKCF